MRRASIRASRSNGIPVKAELRSIIAPGGGDLRRRGDVAAQCRAHQEFHTDLADLPAALEIWDEAMAHAPLPLSAIEVAWLPIPGARVQVDLGCTCPG